ncbi:UPF0755 protein [Pilibacter termitis]|uniref:Endolytic murein transglycosylase n=1 Tax=Pilibacter termitis TaxID=263852 RepID=A0A1T4P2D4_9ENTE|nr:endolytic transglycosylase MltG [Pilibacter termitis]SJZ85653.1 UPF0755 protein [Pilibacter termitis]
MSDKNTTRPGESFKDQVMRALEEGNGQVPPNYSSSSKKTQRSNPKNKQRKAPATPAKKGEKRSTSQLPKQEQKQRSNATRSRNTASKELPKRNQVEQKRLPKKKGRADFDGKDKEDRIVGRIVKTVIIALVILLVIVGISGWSYINKALQPYDTTDKTFVQVEIPIGSSNKQIGGILEQKKIIRSGMVFNYFTKFHNLSKFQSGYYNMQPSMSLEEIAKILQKGGTQKPELPVLGKVLIPEGYTIDQIAEAIASNANSKSAEKTPFTKDEFLKLIKSDEFFNEMKQKYPELLTSAAEATGVKYKLEGYLFPATYDYNEKTTLKSLVETMIATMDQTLQNYYPTIKAKGLSVQEVLALASYVEKEGATEDDRRNIAQVFFNRIKAEMPLQTNISILYAEGRLGQKISAEEDKKINTNINSPYNLYTNQGTGPGPVDSPSLMAIEAVIEPKPNDYLFFLADIKTGKVYFAKTYEEHEALVAEHL